jgi:hypothetical protein
MGRRLRAGLLAVAALTQGAAFLVTGSPWFAVAALGAGVAAVTAVHAGRR